MIKLLPRVASMGFDVLYLPPIHPIGKVNRKGKNNNVKAEPVNLVRPGQLAVTKVDINLFIANWARLKIIRN